MRTITLLLLSAFTLAAGELSNRRAPGFSLPDLELAQHDLYDHRGKVVLLEILKTDCPMCGAMADVLEQVKQKYGTKVSILSIALPPDTQITVRNFVGRHKITYPVLFDCGQAASSYLKVSPSRPRIDLPHIFVIDKQGMIKEDWGSENAVRTLDELSAEIDKLLK